MWLLSCDGDLFGGRRLWLRPGSSHLLGRTSGKSEGGERVQYIDHKSVSRKHLILHLGDLKEADDTRLFSRTEIKAVDSSKTGTTINDEKINKNTKSLDGTEYTIKLGSYGSIFYLRWHPVVLSFTNLPKSTRAKGDAFAIWRARLKSVDVKLATEYVTNQTTHMIAKKRNTANGLQALVQAKWLVTDSFADALSKVCERNETETDGSPRTSLLEEDFDAHWPKEDTFIVPIGGEPVTRPDHYLKPDPTRAEMFEKYAFVFLSQSQHDQLMPVITSGGGKAMVFDFEPGQSQVKDLVTFVNNLASKKTFGGSSAKDESRHGGVVVVRISEKEQGRTPELMSAIDLALNQRSVEQNEFLDAILLNDARRLCTPLRDATQGLEQARDSEVHESSAHNGSGSEQPVVIPDSPEKQPAQQSDTATQKRSRRIVTQSRFKGFNEFDPSQMIRADSDSPEPKPFQEDHVDSVTEQNLRKRPAAALDVVAEEREMLDSILPGATALKRRRIEALENGQTDGLSRSPTKAASTTDKTANGSNKKSSVDKVIDVKGTLKERRRREEERWKQDEESLQDAINVDISDLKDLAQVEEFQLPVRSGHPRASEADNEVGENWNLAWNGRKNFKKFRRKGQPANQGPTLPRTLVRLEEVPRRGHSLNDDYWLQSNASSRSKSKSQSQPWSARNEIAEGNDEDGLSFQRRIQISHEEDADNPDLQDTLPEEVAGMGSSSHTLSVETDRKVATKRAANLSLGGPAKKQRQTTLASSSINVSDDDEDALRFRRKRR